MAPGSVARVTHVLLSLFILSGGPADPLTRAAHAGQEVDVQDSAEVRATAAEPVDQARASRDEALRAELQAVFDRVASLAAVTVSVEAGVVHLGGTVETVAAAERAAELARNRDGVLFVDNEIELPQTLDERLRTTAGRLKEYALDTLAALPLVLAALLIVLAFGGLGSALGRWQGPAFLARRNPFLQSLLRRSLQVAVVLVGLIVALDLMDATALVGAVLGTAGVAGLAIGFAFKDIAENYLAGVILSVRQPFAKNDHLVVGGHEGKVVRLTARETILMTLDGNHVQLPNAIVFREPLLNYTRNPRRRFAFEVGVEPATDLTLALDTGLAALREMAGVMDEPAPEGVILELGDSTVTIRFLGWVDQRSAGFGRVRSEALRLVKLALEHAGVDMPSPEFRIALHQAGAERPEGGGPAPGRPESETRQRDISVDTTIERQIQEDRAEADEEDLLSGEHSDGV